jgi:hypothetical protein
VQAGAAPQQQRGHVGAAQRRRQQRRRRRRAAAMFCAISGNVPEEPVVSKKSGHVFERRLIDKYVAETGRCPVTQSELSADDLLPLASNKTVKPRTAPATSVPGLLGLFHDEWDALMLETHALRQALHTSRQELSHALYQHDAACRVIARLMRERDEARGALDNMRCVRLRGPCMGAARKGALRGRGRGVRGGGPLLSTAPAVGVARGAPFRRAGPRPLTSLPPGARGRPALQGDAALGV